MFSISSESILRENLVQELQDQRSGAMVTFDGLVRNHNEGKLVSSLEYQIYPELALKEGEKILQEAREKFNVHHIKSVHREGHLKLGEIAVWVGATASHRDDAFKACRYVIDEIKHRLPVWKKEHYINENAQWVFCRNHHHHVHFDEKEYYKKQSSLIRQDKLKSARVIVIGAGGLGCPALVSLASSGIGHLTVVDFDKISISNIHRQFLFSPNVVGEKKVHVAVSRLSEINPFIKVHPLDIRIDSSNVESILRENDLVLDCTDNLVTKYLLHDACLRLKIPLVTGSVYRYEGQVRTIIPGTGCLRCHNDVTPSDSHLGNCNDFGILGAVTNVLGSLQASEAITFLMEQRNATSETTLLIDLKSLSQMRIKNTKNVNCPACRGDVELLIEDSDVFLSEISDYELVDIRNMEDAAVEKFIFYDKNVLLYCHLGVRSQMIARELRQRGYKHIYSLKGGTCSL